jgi:hypothetical protein
VAQRFAGSQEADKIFATMREIKEFGTRASILSGVRRDKIKGSGG